MRRITWAGWIGFLALAIQCWAGESPGLLQGSQARWPNRDMKFALHLENHAVHTCAKNVVAISDTSQIVRNLDTWASDGIDVFFVVFDYDSPAAIRRQPRRVPPAPPLLR